MESIKEFNPSQEELDGYKYAVITTSKGIINIELFPQYAPQTVANFANLANNDFYKGKNFHRVISGFMAQGGCPIGNGTGGPGYRIKCELQNNPTKHNKGTISMAHAGRDTGGSQFFICFAPQPHLDGEHTAFGRISVRDRSSYAVLDSIKEGDFIVDIKVVKELS